MIDLRSHTAIHRLAMLHGGFLLPEEIVFLADLISEVCQGRDDLLIIAIRYLGASLRLVRILEGQQ
jgi:hypothetical protein